jgi:hypothetical protein
MNKDASDFVLFQLYYSCGQVRGCLHPKELAIASIRRDITKFLRNDTTI